MSEHAKQSTCANKGHWWVSTASPLVVRCFRTGCHATKTLINGVWQETQPEPMREPAPAPTQQSGLWT